MMGCGKPRLPDVETLRAMGFEKGMDAFCGNLYNSIVQNLRIMDEQAAVNKIRFEGLPQGITNDLIGRIKYYRGQGAFFYVKELEQFRFLPFCLNSKEGEGIDEYGRYTGITPLTFNGKSEIKGKEKVWIPGMIKKPIYDVVQPEEVTREMFEDGCVILRSYTQQLSQTVLPRSALSEQIIRLEAMMFPYLRTALANSTGVTAMRVTDESEQYQVEEASKTVQLAALTGRKWIATIGSIDFQDLSGTTANKATEFLSAMQAIDNFRLETHGLKNNGVFQSKANVLQSQADINDGGSNLVLDDELAICQEFANIVNSVWGLSIVPVLNPSVVGMQANIGDTSEEGNDERPDDGAAD